jgi:nucleoside-diphosphate-sugar epimerase
VLLKTAVITGATGFIGSVLARELINSGINVLALRRPNSAKSSRLDGIEGVAVLEVDTAESFQLPDGDYGVFYHTAWGGARDDFNTQYKNIGTALNCFRAAEKAGCAKFLCTGSQAEYRGTTEPITEETPLDPPEAYGASKIAAYFLTKELARRAGIKHIWTRLFSVYGEHDNAHTLYSRLLTALRKGEDFSLTTNGSHIWNYLHESDAARALRLLGETDVPDGIYNIASATSRPLREYVEVLRQRVNPRATVAFGSEQSRVNMNASTKKLKAAVGEFEKVVFPGLV